MLHLREGILLVDHLRQVVIHTLPDRRDFDEVYRARFGFVHRRVRFFPDYPRYHLHFPLQLELIAIERSLSNLFLRALLLQYVCAEFVSLKFLDVVLLLADLLRNLIYLQFLAGLKLLQTDLVLLLAADQGLTFVSLHSLVLAFVKLNFLGHLLVALFIDELEHVLAPLFQLIVKFL